MRILLYISLICLTHSALAQNVQQELEAVSAKYRTNNYTYTVQYAYYNDAKSASASETYNGFVKQKGNNFHYKIGQNEVFRTAQYIVAIDKSTKLLMLDTVVQEEKYIGQSPKMEDVLKIYEQVERRQEGNLIAYKVNNPQFGLAYMDVFVQPTEQYITKIVMYFYENRAGKDPKSIRNKLEIQFSNVQFNAEIASSYFNATKYITRNKTGYQPAPAYTSYKFLNNLNNK
jgi:hypothetical protein